MCKFCLHTVIGDEPAEGADLFLENMLERISVVGKMVDDLHCPYRGSADLLQALVEAQDIVNAHMSALVA